MAKFIRVHNKMVNLDQVGYIDFLESGRAMVHVSGLSQEKQNIPVEPDEARRLRAFFDDERLDARQLAASNSSSRA